MKKIKQFYNQFITSQYRKIARQEILIQSIVGIKVKKGKRKYSLIVVKTPQTETIFYISRHFTDKNYLRIKDINSI